jgi:hypothetical protein
MLNPIARAHLPAVRFSSRAYMGCGGWDLARAPEVAISSVRKDEEMIPTRASRSATRPRRSIGCGPVHISDEEESEGQGPIVTLQPGLSGTPRVRMGCGDELCEECEAKQRAGIGCTKCKRIRKRAMQQELEGSSSMGQTAPSGFDLYATVTGGLAVVGLFYLVTR